MSDLARSRSIGSRVALVFTLGTALWSTACIDLGFGEGDWPDCNGSGCFIDAGPGPDFEAYAVGPAPNAPPSECLAGRYAATREGVTTCVTCPFGTFADGTGASQCTPRTTCVAGSHVLSSGYATEDRTCAPCLDGTFSETENAWQCAPQDSCGPGTFVAREGSAALARLCGGCVSGTFSAGENTSACVAWTPCPPGTYVVTEGTATSDRVCAPDGAPATSACGDAIDPGDAATWDHDGDPSSVCVPRTRCVAGEYVASEGDASNDRHCTRCPDGAFTSTSNAASCTPLSECPAGTREAVASSSTRDRACESTDMARQFGSSGYDFVASMAIDGSGNVLVGGGSEASLFGPVDPRRGAFVRKYDRTNTEVWTQQFGGYYRDRVCGLATDETDGVIAAGVAYSPLVGPPVRNGAVSAFVRRFDAHGDVAWTTQFMAGGATAIYALVLDGNRAIYVAGYTEGSLGGQSSFGKRDAFIRKLDITGHEVWTRQFGTAEADTNQGLAVDASGNVWAVGQTYRPLPAGTAEDGWDGYLRKLDANGNVLMHRELYGPGAGEGGAMAVAVDASGHVYVAGQISNRLTADGGVGELDGFLARFDSAGEELWRREFGGASNQYIHALAIRADGTILLGGEGFVDPIGPTGWMLEALVVAFDPSGAETWSHTLGTAATDSLGGMVVDALGNVVIGGQTNGTFDGQTASGQQDAFVFWFGR